MHPLKCSETDPAIQSIGAEFVPNFVSKLQIFIEVDCLIHSSLKLVKRDDHRLKPRNFLADSVFLWRAKIRDERESSSRIFRSSWSRLVFGFNRRRRHFPIHHCERDDYVLAHLEGFRLHFIAEYK